MWGNNEKHTYFTSLETLDKHSTMKVELPSRKWYGKSIVGIWVKGIKRQCKIAIAIRAQGGKSKGRQVYQSADFTTLIPPILQQTRSKVSKQQVIQANMYALKSEKC